MKHNAMTVAVAQIPIAMGDKPTNLATVRHAVERAGEERCDIILLPECCFAGWLSPAASQSAETIPGPFTDDLGRLARKYRIAIVIGFEERDSDSVYNSSVFIDRTGAIAATHRKINELDVGLEVYTRGGSLRAFDFEGINTGLLICADCWTPHLTGTLSLMGVELILSPCAWAIDRGREQQNIACISETYVERIQDKRLWIVAANGVGPVTQGAWAGRVLQGESLAFGPEGTKLMHGPRNEAADLRLCLKL